MAFRRSFCSRPRPPTDRGTTTPTPRRIATPDRGTPGYRYHLFGCVLLSDRRLPRFAEPAAPPAGEAGELVRICFEQRPAEASAGDEAWQTQFASATTGSAETPAIVIRRHRETGMRRFRYGDGAELFLRADGRQIWALQPPTMSDDDLAGYLLGPVFACCLRLQGRVCLHGSAVEVDSGAVAFLGDPRAGKSTLAAAFALAGHRPLSDDIVTLDAAGRQFWVTPDTPLLRLWPRSAELLFGDAEALPHLSETWDKRGFQLDGGAAARPARPLAAVYELWPPAADGDPEIVALTGHRALTTLSRHAHAHRLLEAHHRGHELEVLAQVLARIGISGLRRGHGESPQALRDRVLRDLAQRREA